MPETPPFWFNDGAWQSKLLAPLSYIYGTISARLMARPPQYGSRITVFCVGNLIAGGAGKTPTAIALCDLAKKNGFTPAFLTRGYGGGLQKATWVDLDIHNAHDVGDEAI